MACRASWVVLCPVAELSPEAEVGCLGEVEAGDPGAAAGDSMPRLLAGRRMSGDGGVEAPGGRRQRSRSG